MKEREDPVSRALDGFMAMRATLRAQMPLARLVVEHGTAYEGIAYTGRRGPAKQCFRNALHLAGRRGYLYAEGYALSGTLLERGLDLPVEHAWCVDGEGRAVDPTWEKPEASHYLGVAFDQAEAWKRVAEKGTFGMFFDGPAGMEDREFIAAVEERLKLGPSGEERRPLRPA